jgi:hypothetical protein
VSRALRAARDALVLYGCAGTIGAGYALAWWMPAILDWFDR